VTLDVREASIKTASVQIKALTVSGKQVTQSVFRQLLLADLIDYKTGELNGTPWGRVNYYWGTCKDTDHLHVVWQLGEELRRACVKKKRPVSIYDLEIEEDWFHKMAHLRLVQLIYHSPKPDKALLGPRDDTATMEDDGMRYSVVIEQSEYRHRRGCVCEPAWTKALDYMRTPWGEACPRHLYQESRYETQEEAERRRVAEHNESRADFGKELEAALAFYEEDNPSGALSSALAWLRSASQARDAAIAQWRVSYTTVEATDHLFIAV